MPDEPVMSVAPLLLRNELLQLLLRRQRVLALRQLQPVRHAEDMRIHRQCRHIINNAGNDVRRLLPHARQLHERLDIAGDFAIKALHQHMTGAQKILRLRMVQAAVTNLCLHLLLRQAAHLLRRIQPRKKACRNHVHALVRALRRQNDSHQQLEGRIIIERRLRALIGFL